MPAGHLGVQSAPHARSPPSVEQLGSELRLLLLLLLLSSPSSSVLLSPLVLPPGTRAIFVLLREANVFAAAAAVVSLRLPGGGVTVAAFDAVGVDVGVVEEEVVRRLVSSAAVVVVVALVTTCSVHSLHVNGQNARTYTPLVLSLQYFPMASHLQSAFWMFGSSLVLQAAITAASLSAQTPVKGGVVAVVVSVVDVCVAVVCVCVTVVVVVAVAVFTDVAVVVVLHR